MKLKASYALAFYHSLNVAYEAYRLAGIYKADRERRLRQGFCMIL